MKTRATNIPMKKPAEGIDDLGECDKERVAYHEAGHAIVAIAHGCSVFRTHISVNYEVFKILGERRWEGACKYHNSRPEYEPLIAAAGIVAELILSGGWSPDCWLDIEVSELSEPDSVGIHMAERWDECFLRTHAILAEKWEIVDRVARALMEWRLLTEEDLLQLVFPVTESAAASSSAGKPKALA